MSDLLLLGFALGVPFGAILERFCRELARTPEVQQFARRHGWR